MKLVTNSSYSSLFCYFRGIENPKGWTIENPAVFGHVADFLSSERGVVLEDMNGPNDLRYMAVRFLGGIEYVLHSDVPLNVILYDFMNSLVSEVKAGMNGLQRGIVGCQRDLDGTEVDSSMTVLFDSPRIVLARISGYSSSQVSDAVLTCFPFPAEFDLGERWVRDWVNRVDGSSWSVNGKIPVRNGMRGIERSRFDYSDDIPVLMSGAGYQALPRSDDVSFSDESEAEDFFRRNSSVSSFGEVGSLRLKPDSIEGHRGSSLIRLESLFMNRLSRGIFNFSIRGRGWCRICIGGECFGGDVHGGDSHSCVVEHGLSRLVMWYDSGDGDVDVSVHVKPVEDWDFTLVGGGLVFIGNSSSYDDHVNFVGMRSSSLVFDYEYPFPLLADEGYDVFVSVVSKCHSVSFWVMDRSDCEGAEFDSHLLVRCGDIYIVRKSPDSIAIRRGRGLLMEELHCFSGIDFREWHHVCVCFGGNLVTWYLDVSDNGFSIPEKPFSEAGIQSIRVGRDPYLASGGKFEVCHLMVVGRMISAVEVNKIRNCTEI